MLCFGLGVRGRALCLLLAGALVAVAAERARLAAAPPSDAFLIGCTDGTSPGCAVILSASPPPYFRTLVHTTRGDFSVHVVSAWAPPMAQRFHALAELHYFDPAPFYRMLRTNASHQFVAQFGYRGAPAVDAAWISRLSSNVTAPVVAPGNAYGVVAFGTNEVKNDGSNPDCTAAVCSVTFSVELYVNLANNSILDASDFAVFGFIEAADMRVVEALFAGYGECSDLCAQDPSDTYCVPVARPDGRGWAGVNLTEMILDGTPYLRRDFPRLDYCIGSETVLEDSAAAAAWTGALQ